MNQVEIYLKGNNDYKHNGDITLEPIECSYEVEINSSHELTLIHSLDNIGRWKYICEDNLIAIYNDKTKKKEFYRIYNTEKDLFEITAYARPVGYDLVDYVLIDSRPTEKNGQDALDVILANTPFKGHSNINDISTAYYVRKNCLEAITSDDENSFFNRWGGEIYFDNWDIYVNDKIGSDKGLRVELGYNLESIQEKINIDEVATRVIPVGADGIMLDGDKPWVDSKNINKYTHVKTRVIEFSDVKVSAENSDEGFATLSEAQAELKRLVNKAYDNGLDKPTITYTIDMISLRDSVNYADYKILEDVSEGDTVHVKVKKLDIDIDTRVNKINIDKLTGRINSLELGTVEKNFFKDQADIQNKVNNIINKNGTVKANSIEGTINALNTKFKALREIAEQQHVRAMLFEDDVQGSKTYGAMCIGSMGFEIASEKVNGEWQWRTFGTGQGFTADLINAGTLSAINLVSTDGSFKLDLKDAYMSTTGNFLGEKNTLKFGKGQILCNSILRIANIREDIDKDSYILFSHDGYGGSLLVLGATELRFFGDLNTHSGLHVYENAQVDGDLEVKGDKNCLQETKNYKEVPFYSVEDINSLLTITPIEEIYKTELNEKTGNYCKIINFNDLNGYLPNYLLQECLSLEGTDYNIYIDKMSFGDYYIKKYSGYFIVFSDREMEFKYTLMARRKGFEDRDINKHIKTLGG